jgi:hypothetical protein
MKRQILTADFLLLLLQMLPLTREMVSGMASRKSNLSLISTLISSGHLLDIMQHLRVLFLFRLDFMVL